MNKRILTEIWIYPVKSLGGIRVKSAKVEQKGLQYDRRWMLIDEQNMFMTQRIHPLMALFRVAIDSPSNRLVIHFKQQNFSIPLDSAGSAPIQAKIWDDDVEVCEVGEEASRWFSDQLGMRCKLVSFPDANARPVDSLYRINNEQVSLADGYPFLVIGEQSLRDLNSKLQSPLPMNRFRPNMVFTGGVPYEEDSWKNFSVGNNRFVGVKPCARCVLTTIDQDTAERGQEPLATLATYRKQDNKIYFGQNVLAIDHYKIAEGDEISF